MFVAGWNTPGYLPESDPITFDTATEAIRYLADTIDRLWDEDGHWLDVYSQLPYLTPPFSIIANDISFWVDTTEGN